MDFRQGFKPIFISLSPNVEKDDLILALKLLFMPWKWKQGMALEQLESGFKRFLNARHVFLFNSGRTGFLAILRALGLGQDDEILIQGFTCNAAVNPILWAGLKPVFVDIKNETLNIDIEDLKRKISPKSRVILVQHTFGLPAELKEISEFCQAHNLILVEDCAHSLGATYQGEKIGTFGDAAFFSFGRDKIISSVYGGMVATNDDALAARIKKLRDGLDCPSYSWIFQQLLHPLLTTFLVKPLYGFFGLGRWLLILLQRTKVLSKAVHKKEKRGKQPSYLLKKMPNALAILAFHQFKKISKLLAHQQYLAQLYRENLKNRDCILPQKQEGRIYMRYSLLLKGQDTDKIIKRARKKGILLNDGWRGTVVVPIDTNQEKMGYIGGSCPKAEQVAKSILNLPIHINILGKDIQRIIEFIKTYI